MSIIRTPKGWAIEMQPITCREKLTAADRADHYTAVLSALVQTIHTANDNKDFTNMPEYPVYELLESMLPTFENARAMFEALE